MIANVTWPYYSQLEPYGSSGDSATSLLPKVEVHSDGKTGFAPVTEERTARGREIDRTPPSIGRVSLASRVARGVLDYVGYRSLHRECVKGDDMATIWVTIF